MMKDFTISAASLADKNGVGSLYRTVAKIEGGLARTYDEITDGYVDHFLSRSIETGIIVVARSSSGSIVGEIHGYSLGPRVFAHVLGELTIAVHPDAQGMGVGKAMFTEFMRTVVKDRADILRVELIARESNKKAIEFYKKLGFVIEGKLTNRIRSVCGGYESDIPMAWLR